MVGVRTFARRGRGVPRSWTRGWLFGLLDWVTWSWNSRLFGAAPDFILVLVARQKKLTVLSPPIDSETRAQVHTFVAVEQSDCREEREREKQ